MPHIVVPVRSNLAMQMLLEGNLYVVLAWCLGCILDSLICPTHPLNASVLLSATLIALVELLRLFSCYAFNLSAHWPRPKLLLCAIMSASVLVLYVQSRLNDRHCWVQFLSCLWAICVTLELLVAVGLVWTQSPESEALPNWCSDDSNLRARRQQQHTPRRL